MSTYLCLLHILRMLDPFYCVAQLLDRIGQRAHISRNVVEKVHCLHGLITVRG